MSNEVRIGASAKFVEVHALALTFGRNTLRIEPI